MFKDFSRAAKIISNEEKYPGLSSKIRHSTDKKNWFVKFVHKP